MDDIIPWFHQALDTVEEKARRALRPETGERGEWFRSRTISTGASDVWDLNSRSDQPDRGFYRLADSLDPEVVDHITLNDPATALRSIAADRRILREYERLLSGDRLRTGAYWGGARDACKFAVQARAAAYDTEPGYREEWRP